MKTKFITTSIAYLNAEPHIGFLFELLAADVLKRNYQSLGQEVFFLTGTDEHGLKVANAAHTTGKEPPEFTDQLSAKFKALGKQFAIDFDYFIRTTDPQHLKLVEAKWRELAKAGVLRKKTYSGWYCSGCEAFKADWEISNGKCPIHQTMLEKTDEENWFLIIDSQKKAKIKGWINSSVFPPTRRQEIIHTLASGHFDEVSVSRPKTKNSWGIAVPDDTDQVIYVWIDALLNYLSGIEASGRKIEDLWPADIQVVGKDIIKFHGIIWPALLLALGYQLPQKLLVHGFINIDGRKLSKSTGLVVTPQELLDRYAAAGDLAVDAVRYLLFRQLSFDEDSNFVWEDFDALYNGELANGLGNLVARVIGIAKNVEKFVLPASPSTSDLEEAEFEFKPVLEQANALINQADGIITAGKLWENPNDKQLKFKETLNCLLEAAGLLAPFMPTTAQEIRRQLVELDPQPLFPRLN